MPPLQHYQRRDDIERKVASARGLGGTGAAGCVASSAGRGLGSLTRLMTHEERLQAQRARQAERARWRRKNLTEEQRQIQREQTRIRTQRCRARKKALRLAIAGTRQTPNSQQSKEWWAENV